MTDEIKALREEIAKLRERIAILEASAGHAVGPVSTLPQPVFHQLAQPTWVQQPYSDQYAPRIWA